MLSFRSMPSPIAHRIMNLAEFSSVRIETVQSAVASRKQRRVHQGKRDFFSSPSVRPKVALLGLAVRKIRFLLRHRKYK